MDLEEWSTISVHFTSPALLLHSNPCSPQACPAIVEALVSPFLTTLCVFSPRMRRRGLTGPRTSKSCMNPLHHTAPLIRRHCVLWFHYYGEIIPYMNCEKSSVGQSGRSLTCRVKEHQRAVNTNASAVAEHNQHLGKWLKC